MLSPQHFVITPNMHLVIEEILSCNRKGTFKRMFLQSKVIELMLLQLEQIAHESVRGNYSLKKRDIEKIYAVKEFILLNLSKPFTLIHLAKQFETNQYVLKKGFKEIFGTTVFGFLQENKMEQAKKMLLEQDLTIGEVSDLVGYKNPQHFTTAFKRKFGYTPSKLKHCP